MGPGRGNSGKLMLYEFDFLPIFAGAERGSRISQLDFTQFYEWVRATQGALSDPNDVLERCHCLAVIGERGGVVFVEHHRVNSPHPERLITTLADNTSRHGYHVTQQ